MSEERNIKSKLSKQFKNAGFKVPDNYFDNLSKTIEDKVLLNNKSKPTIIMLSRKFYAYAASFIGIIMVLSTIFFFNAKNKENVSLSANDIIEYVELNNYNIDESYFIEAIETAGSDETTSTELEADEIIEYLLSDNINYYTILSEL